MPDYGDYLELDALLDLQRPGGDDHDEMLFIVIHQSYELWFKEVLHELDYLMTLMGQGDLPRMSHTMKRVLTILKMMVAKIDILETMTPLEFLAFRERLESGSGFQSRQFRELEFLLGHKRRAPLDQFAGTPAADVLRRRHETPTLWDGFARFLAGRGFAVPDTVLERDVSAPIASDRDMQAVLLEVYRSDAAVADFCERLVDLDEGFQEWRYRHVKMVERTIGTRRGTGGSSGAEYLRTTLLKPLFPDLWAIRSEF